jgi:hypothetical protein
MVSTVHFFYRQIIWYLDCYLTWKAAYATAVRGRLFESSPILKMSIPHLSISPNV